MPELSAVAFDRMRLPCPLRRVNRRRQTPSRMLSIRHRETSAARRPAPLRLERRGRAHRGAAPARTRRHLRRPDAGRRARAVRAPPPHFGPACSDADSGLLRAGTGRPRRDARRDRTRELAAGGIVYVHCSGWLRPNGCGRRARLVRHGHEPRKALDQVAKARGLGCPQTLEQRMLVLGWERGRRHTRSASGRSHTARPFAHHWNG